MANVRKPDRQLLQQLSFRLQALEYDVLIPLSAKLPHRIGLAGSRLRGRINAYFERDWTELSLGHPYVRRRALAAYRTMFPDAKECDHLRWTIGRYQTIAREEFEGQLAINDLLDRFDWNTSGLDSLKTSREKGRGLVVVMPHLENLFLALLGVAKCLGPTHLMTSDVVEDPRVHPSLRRFFARKYLAYQTRLNGGKFMHVGAGARDFFHEALLKGQVVTVISDAPARVDGPGSWVQWFGSRRKIVNSAWRMAQSTNSQIVAVAMTRKGALGLDWQHSQLVSATDPEGHYELPPSSASTDSFSQTIIPFLEEQIRRNPGGWWAAHLLQDFPVWPHTLRHTLSVQ